MCSALRTSWKIQEKLITSPKLIKQSKSHFFLGLRKKGEDVHFCELLVDFYCPSLEVRADISPSGDPQLLEHPCEAIDDGGW